MMEEQFKDEVMQRRTKLQQQVELLQKQIRAYDVMLAAPHDLLEPPPYLALPVPQTSPVPEPVSSPPAERPAIRQLIFDPTPEELAELTALAASSRRGRRMAKVELAIAECGDTFSLHDIMEVLRTKHGWRGIPSQDDIASALWKVVRRRSYPVVRQGQGRLPTVYSKY